MKHFWKIGLAVACCCAIGVAVYYAVRPELPAEATLPDVSVLGIHSDDFTYSGVYEQEVGIGFEWIGDASEKPSFEWSQYKSESGAYLVFDEHNRLRRFVNSTDIQKAEVSPDNALTSDALVEKATEITNELVMNGNAFSLDTELSTINTTNANVVLTRTISDYAFDASSIELAQDGTVQKLQFEYSDVPADFTPTAMDATVEDYITEKVVPRYNGSSVEYEVTNRYFITIGDTVYGAYSVSITYYNSVQVFDAIGILIDNQ